MGKEEHLGEFEQLTLLAVLRLGRDAYGAQIRKELMNQAGREASVSSIYITLTRLEAKGMVSSWMGEPAQFRGGKARRLFRLEPAGLAALSQARDQLMAMWEGLQIASEGGNG